MAKRKFKPKASSLPKGLPFSKNKKARVSKDSIANANINPFESARASSSKSPKFHVHNRPVSGHTNPNNPLKGAGTALKRAIDNRRSGLKVAMDKSKKAGAFIDRRIGENRKSEMTEEERMLARIVRERSRRSKKLDKFSLGDDEGGQTLSLTHRGKVIDDSYTGKFEAGDVILSDDDNDNYGGQLERADTELHFGGGAFERARKKEASNNPYGPSRGQVAESLGDRYRSRKEELDDLIMRKKYEKAEKAKHKEEQNEKFEGMDEQFRELASLLQFRDKEKDRREHIEAKKTGTLSVDDKEMDDWEKEMKSYLFERKVKATDRSKTSEERAKDEADRLHELETKRLARMNGDFENDDLSDISDNEDYGKRSKKTSKTKQKSLKKRNPDELDSDEEDSNELEAKFTADGLIYVDKDGNFVKKFGEDVVGSSTEQTYHGDDEDETGTSASSEDDDDSLGESGDDASVESDDGLSSGEEEMDSFGTTIAVGTKIKGRYRADEQFEGKGKWYKGTIMKSYNDEAGNTLYDIEYDDGDAEEAVTPENIRLQKSSTDEKCLEAVKKQKIQKLQEKRQKAKDRARVEIPYVLEVPTTLEALHDMIGTYAATGEDASLIIERIHKANSVRLDKRNKEKMQNFYDVLLRRFVGVGDALYKAGDGGEELGRYNQLDSLTKVLYAMAQDSPDSAGAVWGRRIGIFHSALAKRLRDTEFVSAQDDDFTAWPSTGTLLLLRALGHVFPVTDKRHVVITPTLIFLGQTIGQTPVRSVEDVIRGIFCSSLMIEYTRETHRLPSEALSFLAGVISLFSERAFDPSISYPIPSFSGAGKYEELKEIRQRMMDSFEEGNEQRLSLEKDKMSSDITPSLILVASLQLARKVTGYYSSSLGGAQIEAFDPIVKALLLLNPRSKKCRFPDSLADDVRKTADTVYKNLKLGEARLPLLRRAAAKASELAIKTLAPRMEDPDKYSMGKDKNKTRIQAERDKLRREYRREHKAVSRELRLDAVFIENERRKDKEHSDSKAREARNKNHSWLEQEQATMNQQVALGGGLLKGGGIGAARSKAASGKVGIKKGGKMR